MYKLQKICKKMPNRKKIEIFFLKWLYNDPQTAKGKRTSSV
jgi:hypothetical protein